MTRDRPMVLRGRPAPLHCLHWPAHEAGHLRPEGRTVGISRRRQIGLHLSLHQLARCPPRSAAGAEGDSTLVCRKPSASHLAICMHPSSTWFVSCQDPSCSDRDVTSVDLLNYKASLTADVAWYLGSLRGFLRKWHRLGLPGVSDDAASVLRELRIKGNAKGVAVLTMDPVEGPYTTLSTRRSSPRWTTRTRTAPSARPCTSWHGCLWPWGSARPSTPPSKSATFQLRRLRTEISFTRFVCLGRNNEQDTHVRS